MKYRTKQEARWAGELGERYTKHNTIYVPAQNKNTRTRNLEHARINTNLFKRALKGRPRKNIKSVLEFGANVGLNLIAIKKLLPGAIIHAVEINEGAAEHLHKVSDQVYLQSIFDDIDVRADLVISKGLLIHINPKYRKRAYKKLYEHSARYIFLAEHHAKIPEVVEYRGYKDAFWKRNFIGEMLKRYPDLQVLRSGIIHSTFEWHLMEKR